MLRRYASHYAVPYARCSAVRKDIDHDDEYEQNKINRDMAREA